MTRAFLLAGEPSGDRLGGALMAGLKTLSPGITFDGIGGDAMQAEGLISRFPMDELTVFGIAEVLPKYSHLKRRIAEVAKAVVETRPDVLITIDSPDFSLRVAKLVKKASDIRTVHYVAPSVWAWRAGRAAKMARHIDQVLALLPFEPRYMEAAGMRCDFVGHPIVSEPQPTPQQITGFRAEHGLGVAPILLVLPGSRRSEVGRLMPVFDHVVRRVLCGHPDLRVVLPTTPNLAATVIEAAASWPGKPLILDPRGIDTKSANNRKRTAFAAAKVALAASGTVSLELAAASTPMVVAYDMNWLTWKIMSRMLKTDTVTLVNLVSRSRTIPEFLGPACTPPAIAAALTDLMENPKARHDQIKAMAATMEALGKHAAPPGLRAARAVLDGLI